MRYPIFALAASLTLTLTGLAFAQATLPNDDVNIANNPGSVKVEVRPREQALSCTCRIADAGTAGDTANGGIRSESGKTDERLQCTCRTAAPETTGSVATPRPLSSSDPLFAAPPAR